MNNFNKYADITLQYAPQCPKEVISDCGASCMLEMAERQELQRKDRAVIQESKPQPRPMVMLFH